MKFIPAITFLLISFSSFCQPEIKYFKLEELANAPVDSVKAIDASKMKLTQLPPEILAFTEIEYLNLSKNNLSNLEGLQTFSKLKQLDLSRNKMDYFPLTICQLPEIENLILNRNYFETIPACISQCKKLQTIDLWYTAVTMLPEEMTRIETLKLIDLTGVQINIKNQERIRGLFPKVDVKLSPPCNCTN